MKKRAFKLFKKSAGIILIIIGIAGLFLPFVQGILLIILGLALLENQYLKNIFDKLIKFKNRAK